MSRRCVAGSLWALVLSFTEDGEMVKSCLQQESLRIAARILRWYNLRDTINVASERESIKSCQQT